MITHSESIVSITKALLSFQGAVDGVGKNGNNPHFKSKYATLENVRDTAVPELQKVGILYVQSPGPIIEGSMSFTTMLVHPESGEWLKLTGDIPLGKKDPQGAGSAITYMSRYSLMAALGLPAVDDDGETAKGRGEYKTDVDDPGPIQPQWKETKHPLKEGDRRKLWERMMDDLNAEAPKGSDAMIRYMQHPDTQRDLATLEPWKDRFRKEAKDLIDIVVEAEKATGDNVAGVRQLVPPNFDNLQQ